jgi:hypothetical protein
MKNATKLLICVALLTLVTSNVQAGRGKSSRSGGRSFSSGKSFSGKSLSRSRSSSGRGSLSGTKSSLSRATNKLSSSARSFNGTTKKRSNGSQISRSVFKSTVGNVKTPVTAKRPNVTRRTLPTNKLTGGLQKIAATRKAQTSISLGKRGVTGSLGGQKAFDKSRLKDAISKGIGKKLRDQVNVYPKGDGSAKGRVEAALKGIVRGGLPSSTHPATGGHDGEGGHKHKHWHLIKHLHHRVCLPPIVRCPPPRVCPPSVLAVCPGAEVIVVERTTEQVLADFLAEPTTPEEPAFVLDLESNAEVSLEIDGLAETPGALVLEVNQIGLPVEVLLYEQGVLDIRVPSVGLVAAQLGKLYVLNADLQLVAAVDVRLHPGTEAE